jgi:hypothetical protein
MPSPVAHGSLILVVRALAGRHTGLRQAIDSRSLFFYVAALVILWAPDIDFLLRLFVPGRGVWGHGGATHSLVSGLLFGFLFAVACRMYYGPAIPMVAASIVGTACAWSHALMDMATYGRGVSLLWPFLDERFTTVTLFFGARHSQPTAWRLHLITLASELLTIAAVWLLLQFAARRRRTVTGQAPCNGSPSGG